MASHNAPKGWTFDEIKQIIESESKLTRKLDEALMNFDVDKKWRKIIIFCCVMPDLDFDDIFVAPKNLNGIPHGTNT